LQISEGTNSVGFSEGFGLLLMCCYVSGFKFLFFRWGAVGLTINNNNMKHRFNYEWTLKDANFTKDKGKVFSCFACGGGSTMGYKLAGFDVLGCNEIDPKMIEAYKANHNPKYAYLEPIQTFKMREDFPQELYELDILDGSPPCSSFSMAGNREKDWGKEKVFREGQAEQVLDTLFFDFIDLAKKLQPKVVVAENVKGLLLGEAKQYVRQIYREFDLAGYYCQHWLLDASKMGVPQKRERVFFIAMRKDLAEPFLYNADMFTIVPKLELIFKEPEIKFGEYREENGIDDTETERGKLMEFRIKSDKCCSDINERVYGKFSGFNAMIRHDDEVCGTITSGETDRRFYDGKILTENDLKRTGSYPLDYNFCNDNSKSVAKYFIGMSVPPVMTANIATEIYTQWLSKLL
jgi:DNA (cytosine-5)-methyltransferase 1